MSDSLPSSMQPSLEVSMRRSRLRRIVPVVAIVGLVSASLLAPATQAAKPPTIFINGDSVANYAFAPRTLEINRRETVHWLWDSNVGHNVTFPKLDKNSVTGASETFKLKFKKRGTFKYVCTVHGFRGKIVVK